MGERSRHRTELTGEKGLVTAVAALTIPVSE